ncbi:MAG: enoyl-ACP reductase [Chloroflexi bacterium]|nr:enoyl-ACP reductase [Chloroflexota bacterium]
MYSIDLSGKAGVIFGVANHRSIAWHIAQAIHAAGARIFLTYQNERLRDGVVKLADTLGERVDLLECDVSTDENVASALEKIGQASAGRIDYAVHSIAYANREDLGGDFSKTGRDGFKIALEVSAYSLIPIARYAAPLMTDGGSIIALTFQASDRVFPGYNVMGTAKAALENEVRQLAYELGGNGIRVNALSPGPLDTLSSRAIHGYVEMKRVHAERSPLRRNITHEEVAKVALFLLSDLSSGITGTIIPVDGGYHIAGV